MGLSLPTCSEVGKTCVLESATIEMLSSELEPASGVVPFIWRHREGTYSFDGAYQATDIIATDIIAATGSTPGHDSRVENDNSLGDPHQSGTLRVDTGKTMQVDLAKDNVRETAIGQAHFSIKYKARQSIALLEIYAAYYADLLSLGTVFVLYGF